MFISKKKFVNCIIINWIRSRSSNRAKNESQTPSDDGASFIASYLSQTYPTVKTLFTDKQVCQLNAFEILKDVDMTDIKKKDIIIKIPEYGDVRINDYLPSMNTFYVDKILKFRG